MRFNKYIGPVLVAACVLIGIMVNGCGGVHVSLKGLCLSLLRTTAYTRINVST